MYQKEQCQKAFQQMLQHCCGDFHSATRALVRSGTDVAHLGLPRSGCSNSSQRWLMALRSGLCARQSSSSTPILTKHFCMDLALCTGALSCWNRKGPSPNCCHNVGSTEWSRMSLNAVVLRFTFTGTKEPEPWKTAPDHYSSSTKLYSWHYALGQVAFSWHPPNPDSSVGLPDLKAWFITPENDFPMRVQCPGALHQYSWHLALCVVILCLCVAARQWKPISWSSRQQLLCWCCFQGQFRTR